MRRLSIALLLLGACAYSPTPDAETGVSRDALKLHISGYEDGPKADRLAALGGDVAGEILKIAQDPREQMFFRGRALTALAFYPEERVFQYLASTISGPEALGAMLLPSAV